ncbi:DUF6301 family protein [Actinoplanes oblitus]|uniref:DUF6301 family protein n=1 Tax=Actinoplanes oblitus TaxID=3040509 RepID=A0ABY8WSZ8_9ACTN|nr:DUF6301 family protein [Actinoplanes oblitus]WIN00112.1 DUF6301 family protein [Actinoplanes oblitus]
MAGWRALDEPTISRAAANLLSAERWLLTATLTEVAAGLGWTVTRFKPERPRIGAFLDAGHGLGPTGAYFRLDGDARVREISMNITEEIAADAPGADDFKQDIFGTAASALTDAHGRPSELHPGAEPEIWWRRDTATFRLVTKSDAIALQLTPNTLLVGD